MNSSTHINSRDGAPCPYAVSVFFTTALAVVNLAAVIGNIFVVVTVFKTPSLRTSTNYYYVNMAISDFISSIITWPLYLTDEIVTSRGSLIQGPLATTGCKVGVFVRNLSHSVSVLSLVLIAVDRYIAIVFPLKATLLITKKIRGAFLLSTWLISIGYCFPTFHFSRVEDVGQETFCILALDAYAITVYYTFYLIMIITSLIAIIILYSRIMRVLKARVIPGCQTEGSSAELHRRNNYNHNVMKIFRSIVVTYFVCWFLFCIYLILKIISPELFKKDKCKLILGFSYYVFPMLYTVINPVILFSFSLNFSDALKKLFGFSLSSWMPCWKAEIVAPYPENDCLPEQMGREMRVV